LSGFDRLVFRGCFRELVGYGLERYLWAAGVLVKDFFKHAEALSDVVKDASQALADRTKRPLRYLRTAASDKEAIARRIAAEDKISDGLICILSVVEPCWSYEMVRDRAAQCVRIEARPRKCLHLYHYQLHPELGFMHARIQTWFPFQVQVCVNGREWLARRMSKVGLGYERRDNCFTWLADVGEAQRLMDEQLKTAWPELLNALARGLNPKHEEMFQKHPLEYYWSVYQSEWASDVMFRDPSALARLYPTLVRHGMTTFQSPDVLRFLGQRVTPEGGIPPQLKAEVVCTLKTRPEGVRIKHRLGHNSIKMYDKQGSCLRVETTINDAGGFKSFRRPEGKPDAPLAWLPMRKGIADLHRRAEVSQAANDRYFDALAAVEDHRSLGELADHLCRPVLRDGRRARALNPYAPDDAQLLQAVNRGEFAIRGFRNRDLRALIFDDEHAPAEHQRRHAAAVTRRLALLRAHRLVRKIPATHRYVLTKGGRAAIAALMTARNASADSLVKLAA
jgi:hypothetical protein